jgi:hypothetical protein
MKEKLEGFTTINSLMEEIINQRPDSTQEFNDSLKELNSFMLFFQKEIPQLIQRWKDSEKNKINHTI